MAKGPKRPARRTKPIADGVSTDLRRDAFVANFMVTPEDPTGAALKAGYSKNGINTAVHRLMRNAQVRAKIDAFRAEQAKRTEITSDKVLKRWWEIACADPNDLVQFRRANCRHCWGIGHAYQWTEAEYDRACAEARLAAKRNAPSKRRGRRRIIEDDENDDALYEGNVKLPDDSGGFGFMGGREPNPECPECFGEGYGEVHVADTRRLTGAARRLYAGVKKTKDGIEIKMRDQDAALVNVARHLGMFEKDGDRDAPANVTNVYVNGDVQLITQVREQLGEIYGATIEGDLAEDDAGGDCVLPTLPDDGGGTEP